MYAIRSYYEYCEQWNGSNCSCRIFMIGEIMKNKTLYKLLSAMTFTLFAAGISASSVYAAGTAEKQAVLLDELHAGQDVKCADCHGDGNKREAVTMVKCLECHDTAELAEKTANVKPTNPHKNRHYNTEADCNLSYNFV